MPVWSRDGRELHFVTIARRQMLAVPVQTGTTLVAGRPEVLFDAGVQPPGGGRQSYDLAPDGRFFLIRSAQGETTAPRRRT